MKLAYIAIGALCLCLGFGLASAQTQSPVARTAAPQPWEMADLEIYNDGSYYGAVFEPAQIKIEVQRTGDPRTDPWPGAYAAACQKLGGTGSLQNRVALSGWEPFAVTAPIKSDNANRITYHFRRLRGQ